MNAVGIKTEQRTSAIATNAPPTSVMALRAASRGLRPFSMWCSIASTTTIASSTTMPIARTMPKSEMLLIENPKASIAANVPINETGIGDERNDRRAPGLKKNKHNENDKCDRFEQCLLHFVDGFAHGHRRVVNNCVVEAGGKRCLSSAIFFRTASEVARAFEPGSWKMAIAVAGFPPSPLLTV